MRTHARSLARNAYLHTAVLDQRSRRKVHAVDVVLVVRIVRDSQKRVRVSRAVGDTQHSADERRMGVWRRKWRQCLKIRSRSQAGGRRNGGVRQRVNRGNKGEKNDQSEQQRDKEERTRESTKRKA